MVVQKTHSQIFAIFELITNPCLSLWSSLRAYSERELFSVQDLVKRILCARSNKGVSLFKTRLISMYRKRIHKYFTTFGLITNPCLSLWSSLRAYSERELFSVQDRLSHVQWKELPSERASYLFCCSLFHICYYGVTLFGVVVVGTWLLLLLTYIVAVVELHFVVVDLRCVLLFWLVLL